MSTPTSFKARRYHSGLTEEAYDVIIIGSGLGGLTTARLLAQAGKRVLVLERHYVPGGFTQTFQRKIFDHITGGRLQWASMGDVYDIALIDGDRYEFVAGRDKQIRRDHCGGFRRADGIDDPQAQPLLAHHEMTSPC